MCCCPQDQPQLIDLDWPDVSHRSIVGTVDSAIRQSDLELLRLSVLTDATTQKIAIKKWVAQESGQQVDNTSLSIYVQPICVINPFVLPNWNQNVPQEIPFFIRNQYVV